MPRNVAVANDIEKCTTSLMWRTGALRTEPEQGGHCLGCCWILMALLFVGGVMNLVWIAALTLIVLVEKLAPRGKAFGNFAGALLIAWAVATLLV